MKHSSDSTRASTMPPQPPHVPGRSTAARWAAFGEIAVIVCLFAAYCDGPPPDVNEAHYLTKARHYWDPTWCARDLFLQSADIHVVYFWTIGWLTKYGSLELTAHLGRLVGWTALAAAWYRLHHALFAPRWLSVFSAAWFLLGVEHGAMAGEWVVGGVEGKVFAYALLVWALAAWVAGNWRAAWLRLGAASLFHVLVGGWGFIAALGAWLFQGRDRAPLRAVAPWWAMGGVLLTLAALPALQANAGASAEQIRQANRIMVYERLHHHLAFHAFSHAAMARFAAVAILWWLLGRIPRRRSLRFQRLHTFVVSALAIAVTGISIDQLTLSHLDFAAGILKYYWYRLADVLVPMGAVLALFARCRAEDDDVALRHPVGVALLVVAPFLGLAYEFAARPADSRPVALRSFDATVSNAAQARRKSENWLGVCRWIRQETPPDALFVTPRRQYTFKWYAERAEVVNWKDVPQDAPHVVEWRARIERWYGGRAARHGVSVWTIPELVEKMRADGAEYLVLERAWLQRDVASPLRQVYPTPAHENRDFVVWHLPSKD